MRIDILAIGRLKQGGERQLTQRYYERFRALGRGLGLTGLDEVELAESRAGTADLRRTEEAQMLLQRLGDGAVLVALDARGKQMGSEAFAERLRGWRDDGRPLVFALGGPDGHGEALLSRADLVLSLGPMTLPHGLARVVLAEQLYRAATILAGHPYHRA